MLPKGRLRPVRVVREKVVQTTQAVPGPQGGVGLRGPQGPVGAVGANGAVPEHRWAGDEIQFQNPDGSWGKKRNLQGPRGFVGGGTTQDHYRYTLVDTATHTVTQNQTVPGLNIFGVNYAGAVTITLPESLPLDRVLIFNDESGSAGSNTITVQVP